MKWLIRLIYWFLGDDRGGVRARSADNRLASVLRNEYRWRKARNAHLKKEAACQMCGVDRELEVHHVKPWHLFEALRYDDTNLITLCQPCHYRFGHIRNWNSWNPRIKEMAGWTRGFIQQLKTKEYA